jgi:hypothetical protein
MRRLQLLFQLLKKGLLQRDADEKRMRLCEAVGSLGFTVPLCVLDSPEARVQ